MTHFTTTLPAHKLHEGDRVHGLDVFAVTVAHDDGFVEVELGEALTVTWPLNHEVPVVRDLGPEPVFDPAMPF